MGGRYSRLLILLAVVSPAGLWAETSGPTAYREAPLLREQVRLGKLPPVTERLPENPKVEHPVDSMGNYGGTLRRALRSEVEDFIGIDKALGESLTNFHRPRPDGIDLNLAESADFSADGRTLVVKLRRGLRWSDGALFTVDDILFWYEDMLLDADARPQGFFLGKWRIGSEPVRFEQIDSVTLRITSAEPMGRILEAFASNDFCAFPKHYYKQFHPRYTSSATYLDFRQKTSAVMLAMNPDAPTLRAWRPVEWVRGQRIVFERNPFYWKVDPAGNQLPYADRLTFTMVLDPRLIHLKFMNGELDIFGRYGASLIYPTLMEGRERGDYRVFLARPGRPQSFFLNWDAPDPELRTAFRNLRVRQALSHAIDREEIRDALYHGIVFEPSGYGFSPLNAYYNPAHYMRYIEYRPDLSTRLLEEAGYRDKDGDGYREFHDGRRFELTIDYVGGKEESDVVQFVAEYWEAIGIKVHLNVGLGNVIYSRRLDGKFDVFQGLADGAEDIFTRLESWGIFNVQSPWWHRSASEEGPAWLERATELMREAMTLRDPEELARNLAEVNRLHSENVPVIAIGPLMKVWGANTNLGNVSGDVISSDAFRGWGRPVAHELLYFKDAGESGNN